MEEVGLAVKELLAVDCVTLRVIAAALTDVLVGWASVVATASEISAGKEVWAVADVGVCFAREEELAALVLNDPITPPKVGSAVTYTTDITCPLTVVSSGALFALL